MLERINMTDEELKNRKDYIKEEIKELKSLVGMDFSSKYKLRERLLYILERQQELIEFNENYLDKQKELIEDILARVEKIESKLDMNIMELP